MLISLTQTERDEKPILTAYNHQKGEGEGQGHSAQHVEHKPQHGYKERLEKVHTVATENIPVELPTQPTPAAHVHGDDNLHPFQNAASMADVYFLGKIGCDMCEMCEGSCND